MNIILIVFLKKIIVQVKWTILGPKMACPPNSGSIVNERGKEMHKIIVMVFPKSYCLKQVSHFVPEIDTFVMTHPHN